MQQVEFPHGKMEIVSLKPNLGQTLDKPLAERPAKWQID
jgi:hypothetical protein